MRLNKKASSAIGCIYLIVELALIVAQIVFLTMKVSDAVSWSWWAVLTPTFCMIGFPLAFIVIAILALLPKAVIEDRRKRKRVEAEAEKYGMRRKPGESTEELKKRIIQRNMITGSYTRKEIKDMILEAFPTVGSCQILIDNQTDEIVLLPRVGDPERHAATFTEDELFEIAKFAAQYIPIKYTITARNAEA